MAADLGINPRAREGNRTLDLRITSPPRPFHDDRVWLRCRAPALADEYACSLGRGRHRAAAD